MQANVRKNGNVMFEKILAYHIAASDVGHRLIGLLEIATTTLGDDFKISLPHASAAQSHH